MDSLPLHHYPLPSHLTISNAPMWAHQGIDSALHHDYTSNVPGKIPPTEVCVCVCVRACVRACVRLLWKVICKVCYLLWRSFRMCARPSISLPGCRTGFMHDNFYVFDVCIYACLPCRWKRLFRTSKNRFFRRLARVCLVTWIP